MTCSVDAVHHAVSRDSSEPADRVGADRMAESISGAEKILRADGPPRYTAGACEREGHPGGRRSRVRRLIAWSPRKPMPTRPTSKRIARSTATVRLGSRRTRPGSGPPRNHREDVERLPPQSGPLSCRLASGTGQALPVPGPRAGIEARRGQPGLGHVALLAVSRELGAAFGPMRAARRRDLEAKYVRDVVPDRVSTVGARMTERRTRLEQFRINWRAV